MDKRGLIACCSSIAYMIVLLIITICVYYIPSRKFKGPEICLEQDGTVSCESSEFILSMKQKLDTKYKDLLKKENETKDKAAESVFSSTSVNRLIPAALYIGTSLDEKEIENISRPFPITAWDRAVNRPGLCGFQRYGVGIHNGRIIVPVGGLYHVYSFFNFFEEFPSANNSANIEKPGIDHGIYRFNIKDGKEKRLVSLIHPHQFPFRRAFNIYSSYVSLFVELKAGDEVSIKVNYPEYIRNTEINLFGLTLV